jgi:type I restriction enzyme, S subunit
MSFEVGHNMNFKLPTEWKWHELVELQGNEKRPIISGPFGSNIGSRYFQAEGVPVIRGNNLSLNVSDRFIDEGFVFLSEEKAKELNTWATKNDILFTAAGTIGQVGLIESNSKFPFYIISNKQIRVRLNTQIILPQYAYYWLSQPLMIKYIQQRNTGSTIPLINLSVVKSLPIAVPPVNVQKKIISIISSLDDKIKLNRQINQTLEAIAQAIFKEWFVDFNFPGATGEMQDSELGRIPKAWKVYKIGDLVETVSITHKFPKCKAIFLNTSDIEEGKVLHSNYSDKGSLPGQAKKTIKKLDILFTEIRPANKRYALIDFDADDFVVSTKLMVLRSRSNIHPITIYNFLTSDDTLKELQHLAESRSGTFPQITFDQVKALKLVLPDSELLEKYEKTAWSIFNQIKNNEEQTKILTQLRDALLPKLMKGEITAK